MVFKIYVNIHNVYRCADQSLLLRVFYLFCIILPLLVHDSSVALQRHELCIFHFYSLSPWSCDIGILFHGLRDGYMLRSYMAFKRDWAGIPSPVFMVPYSEFQRSLIFLFLFLKMFIWCSDCSDCRIFGSEYSESEFCISKRKCPYMWLYRVWQIALCKLKEVTLLRNYCAWGCGPILLSLPSVLRGALHNGTLNHYSKVAQLVNGRAMMWTHLLESTTLGEVIARMLPPVDLKTGLGHCPLSLEGTFHARNL